MIEIRHLRKEYENATPLEDVSTVIRDGDIIAVIGPSGTGKSTLLRCLNLLERPDAGQIFVDGTDITKKDCNVSKIRQKMGMVFQSFNLFHYMTVIENIMYAPVKLRQYSRQAAYDKGMNLLRKVGLAERAMNYPDALSGGQKQRVAIARALAMDPDIILFDEPTSALDPTMVGEVQAVIEELARSGKTMMVVTHEMAFARKIANRVFYMDEGGIYEDGTPEEVFLHPKKEKTRWFVKKLKVLTLEIRSRDYDFVGADAEIDKYCYKNRISPKLCLRMQSVVEELCQQILLPIQETPDILVTIEYAEEQEDAVITVEYSGGFHLEETKNQLAYAVLQARASSIEYEDLAMSDRQIVHVKIRQE